MRIKKKREREREKAKVLLQKSEGMIIKKS